MIQTIDTMQAETKQLVGDMCTAMARLIKSEVNAAKKVTEQRVKELWEALSKEDKELDKKIVRVNKKIEESQKVWADQFG